MLNLVVKPSEWPASWAVFLASLGGTGQRWGWLAKPPRPAISGLDSQPASSGINPYAGTNLSPSLVAWLAVSGNGALISYRWLAWIIPHSVVGCLGVLACAPGIVLR